MGNSVCLSKERSWHQWQSRTSLALAGTAGCHCRRAGEWGDDDDDDSDSEAYGKRSAGWGIGWLTYVLATMVEKVTPHWFLHRIVDREKTLKLPVSCSFLLGGKIPSGI
jgi:hypothetical protein